MTGRQSCWMVLVGCSLILAGLFSDVRPAVAQFSGECPLPAGATPIPDPLVTAQQVEDGSATLKDFALDARRIYRALNQQVEGLGGFEGLAQFGCRVRQEGSPSRSGSIYLVSLSPDGRVFVHAKDMSLSGRQLNPFIYTEILSALGASASDLANLTSYDPSLVREAFASIYRTLLEQPDGSFDATTAVPGRRQGFPGASGYAAVYMSNFLGGTPMVLLAGFDLNKSHVIQEAIDDGNPAITAREVVDRATLKAFVTGALEFIDTKAKGRSLSALSTLRIALRDPNGPWRHGSVYLYVLDQSNNIILLHGAFPDRFELLPLVATVRDAVTGELVLPQVIEAAKSSPEGGFVEYYFDDPNDDTDSADIPKVGYARQFDGQVLNVDGTAFPLNIIVGSGFYRTTSPAEVMTTFLPVVLDSMGKNDSHFTSELALTNRGSEAAVLNYTYTAEAGGGSGTATDMLGPHQQMITTNAIDYLRGLEVPIPETGNRVGTLRVDVSGSSEVSAVVRTTTAVPEGRAGLAYLGVPENEGFHDEAVYLCGLRETQGDRSNVAIQNMGSEGSITLRTTVFSGNPADPAGEMLEDMTLGPGEFHQFNAVLQTAGKGGPIEATYGGGYVKVERVEGMAPFYAYGVINDNANSDGSFVFPVSADSLEGALWQILPALVEINQFTTELTLTNFSNQTKVLLFSESADNTTGFGPVLLAPGHQYIIPNALQLMRQTYELDVPAGFVAPLAVASAGGDLSGVVIGARVVAQADPQDPSRGQYGVFYTAAPPVQGFTRSAWVDGLQQNEENRSNLALINTGGVDYQDIVFEIDIYDGKTATRVKTVTMAEEARVVVPVRGFRQINAILGTHAPGTTQGYVRIRKVSGANPFLAYGVVNDGRAPGERTGDGAYIRARE